MPKRKEYPPVVKPSGRRRMVELGKDALIVALIISAVLLTAQTPIATSFREWMSPAVQPVRPMDRQPKEAVEPYGIAVRNSRGLYGVIYDAGQVEGAFHRLLPLLEEGLATAGAPERIGRIQWQAFLEEPGICFLFQGYIPLRILSAWLGGGEPSPEGQARTLLLTGDGEEVWLCWREEAGYYRAPAQVNYEGSMKSIIEEFNPNGVAYAYTLAGTDGAYASIDPDTLIPMTLYQPKPYVASAPDLVGSREEREKLLAALGFRSGVNTDYEVGGDLAINESGDRLRLGSDGTVTFHGSEEEARYPVAAREGNPSAEEAATAAWDLLNRATAPWRGENSTFVLTGTEKTEEGWTITFQSRLDGIPLRIGEEGWSASFTVAARKVTDFVLTLRSYVSVGKSTPLPGQRLAAAALGAEAYGDSGRRLTLCYNDKGTGPLVAGWMAEE